MRLGQNGICLLLAASLIAAPAGSAPKPLGLILQAQKAQMGNSEALGGATLFAGDTLSTAENGSISLRVSGTQLYLLPSSSATFDGEQGWNVAALHRGSVGFSTQGKDRIVVRGSNVQVYPSTEEPTHGEVRLEGPNQLLVTNYRGALEVMVGGDVIAVPAATAYRVALEAEPQEVEGVGKEAARRAKVIGVITGLSIAAVAITLILLKNAVSPSIP